ncbi:MAG: hypothetical protein GKR94_02055 [Gammaproteobacteria bacterium]|nr:hypothetical protein [Gammaproteobacteria bacterium]
MCNATRYTQWPQAGKRRRKRHRAYDSRGVLAGKRTLEQRPAGALHRSPIGYFEIDTVMSAAGELDCIVTLIDRQSPSTP